MTQGATIAPGEVTGAILAGAHIVRVHAVDKMVNVVRVADALRLAAGVQ